MPFLSQTAFKTAQLSSEAKTQQSVRPVLELETKLQKKALFTI